MYEIKLKVNGNGTLSTGSNERLRLGTEGESNRAKFIFDIDSTVEGTFQYVKFLKGNLSFIYRLSGKQVIINRSVLSSPGIWHMTFISTNSGIVDGEIKGTYAFITEPIEAVVYAGILNRGVEVEEVAILKELIKMNMSTLVIPDGVDRVGDYFFYNSNKTIDVKFGRDVESIGAYTFYKAVVNDINFDACENLHTLDERAFNNITFNNNVVIPNTVVNWGKNAFKGSSGPQLSFDSNSKCRTLGSYAFWENDFVKIYLPDKLTYLGSGNTYAIKNCKKLKYLWIPNTLTTTITSGVIGGCTALETIELQSGFNVSANFSECTALTKTSIVAMLRNLKNLKGSSAKSLTLGSTNLTKLTADEIAIATNKNWTLS